MAYKIAGLAIGSLEPQLLSRDGEGDLPRRRARVCAMSLDIWIPENMVLVVDGY